MRPPYTTGEDEDEVQGPEGRRVVRTEAPRLRAVEERERGTLVRATALYYTDIRLARVRVRAKVRVGSG